MLFLELDSEPDVDAPKERYDSESTGLKPHKRQLNQSLGAENVFRPEGYGMIGFPVRTCENQTVPFGTALLGPRHFVPGYDHTVPPGQKAIAHRRETDVVDDWTLVG